MHTANHQKLNKEYEIMYSVYSTLYPMSRGRHRLVVLTLHLRQLVLSKNYQHATVINKFKYHQCSDRPLDPSDSFLNDILPSQNQQLTPQAYN